MDQPKLGGENITRGACLSCGGPGTWPHLFDPSGSPDGDCFDLCDACHGVIEVLRARMGNAESLRWLRWRMDRQAERWHQLMKRVQEMVDTARLAKGGE